MDDFDNIIQVCIGNILIGDAGISNKQKREGYVKCLCTMDNTDRQIDIFLTQKQINMIKEQL